MTHHPCQSDFMSDFMACGGARMPLGEGEHVEGNLMCMGLTHQVCGIIHLAPKVRNTMVGSLVDQDELEEEGEGIPKTYTNCR